MNVEELLARADTRGLLATYTRAGDRGGDVTMAFAFAEDGVLDGSAHRVGRAAIIHSQAARATTETGPDRKIGFSRRNPTTSFVTFEDGRTATGRTHFAMATQIGVDHTGADLDRFRKVDGDWRIRRRNVRIDWAATNSHVRRPRPIPLAAT